MSFSKCTNCSRSADPPFKRCSMCRQNTLRTTNRKRAEYLALGLCRNCGSQTQDGKKHCPFCLQKASQFGQKKNSHLKQSESCYDCGQPQQPGFTRCRPCLDKAAEVARAYRQRRRDRILAAYGGPRCQCCSEADPLFLVVDHIDGGGNKHRREIGGMGFFQGWLVKNNFPPGFRILCHNCNYAESHGGCPHRLEQEKILDSLAGLLTTY